MADYQARAAQWLAVGRPDQAMLFHGAVLDLHPDDTRTRMMLANCLVQVGRPSDAAEHYLQVMLDYGASRRDREAVAIGYQVLHLDARRFEASAVAPTLQSMGRSASPLCTRAADIHLAAGRVAQALPLLQQAVQLDPRNPEAHRQLAQALLSQNQRDDAVAHLAEAGRLLRTAGNNARYVELAEQLLHFDPGHLETLRELPRIYLRIGEPQRAVVKLSTLMRVSPGDAVGFEILAQAFAVIGRVSTAVSILQRLVDELVATDRRDQAGTILDGARGWRLDDRAFLRALDGIRQALHTRRPPAPPAPAARPQTRDGTVVLNIADLMEAEALPPPAPRSASARGSVVDLSDDVVEIDDAGGTMTLRLDEFSLVRRAPVAPPVVEEEQTVPRAQRSTLEGSGEVTAWARDVESIEIQVMPPPLPRKGPPPPPRKGPPPLRRRPPRLPSWSGGRSAAPRARV